MKNLQSFFNFRLKDERKRNRGKWGTKKDFKMEIELKESNEIV
jgi:hypothetical protein